MNEFKDYTDIDFKILDFIIKNSPVHKDKILKKFSKKNFATALRVKVLKENQLISESFDIENTDLGDKKVYTGFFSVTEKGIKLILDYQNDKSNENKKIFKSSFLYPFLVSLLTALITSCVANYYIKIFNLFS